MFFVYNMFEILDECVLIDCCACYFIKNIIIDLYFALNN